MRSNSPGSGHVWIALVLAVAAVILSIPRRGTAYQEVSSILVAIAEPEAEEVAGAIGVSPAAVPP